MLRELREVPVKQGSRRSKVGNVFGHPAKSVKTTPRAALYARVSNGDAPQHFLYFLPDPQGQ